MSNQFTGTRIEFHILQSFPVSCLNRDDVGAPKSAIIGGVERARVSSQCWKRAVRLALQAQGVKIADRTKLVTGKITARCEAKGASPEQARQCGEAVAKAFTKTVKDGVSDTLFFISNAEAEQIASACAENGFSPLNDKELVKLLKQLRLNSAKDGLDIALFGRMVASLPELNQEAAASFAHALSTHKATSEIDFFTAVDDCNCDDPGAAHMGSLEFNSATYYRYVSLDLGQLAENLHMQALDGLLDQSELLEAVNAFVKALFVAFPAARQATMAAACPWNYAIVCVRHGQGMQLAFNKPVRPQHDEDMVSASIRELQQRFAGVERMYGSLFGLKAKFEIGEQSGDIDSLLASLQQTLHTL